MRIYMNERRARSLGRLGKITMNVGLGLALASLIVALIYMSRQMFVLFLPLGLAFAGSLVAQLGQILYSRWGRHPRVDEVLDAALKGADERVAIFHYALGASHALVSPAGVFALIPIPDGGLVQYQDEKWWVTSERRGFLQRGGKRALPDLTQEARGEATKLKGKIVRYLPSSARLEIQPILVFLHPEAMVETENAAELTTHVKKLKELVRHLPKKTSLSTQEVDQLAAAVHLKK